MRKLKNSELNRLSVSEFKKIEKQPIILVLDNIRSLSNIGSIFRTCDAFLIEKIFLCGITACPPNPDINKTALGATKSVDWEYFESSLECLKNLISKKYSPIAIEQTESSIKLNDYKFEKKKKLAFVFGNEIAGIQQNVIDICKECIEIPQMGTKHSLNISVCVGIILWKAIE